MVICVNDYRPKRSFGQGNIFTSVCLSTGGVGIPTCLAGQILGGWVSQHALQVRSGGVLQFFGGSPIFFWGVVSNFSGGVWLRGEVKGGPPNFFFFLEFLF